LLSASPFSVSFQRLLSASLAALFKSLIPRTYALAICEGRLHLKSSGKPVAVGRKNSHRIGSFDGNTEESFVNHRLNIAAISRDFCRVLGISSPERQLPMGHQCYPLASTTRLSVKRRDKFVTATVSSIDQVNTTLKR
ncbi:MAG: hypothetical protein J0L75_21035, partial [Spirochaetes bacterium]|nr:hypothetical protein [Spirochaetota bacterium]